MKVEIISTGTELLLGDIVDTNSQYLSQKLNNLGFSVLYKTTVGDNEDRMLEVLNQALPRADIIITTGGLGPTQGDITKEVTAKLAGCEMVLDDLALNMIKERFQKMSYNDMPESNIKQALVPKNSYVLYNNNGTAPGLIVAIDNKIIVNLPGPPHEMKAMFEESLVPYLQKRYGDLGTIHSKVLKTIGLGESWLAEKLQDIISAQSNPTIALYARNNEMIIRLTAKATSKEDAIRLINDMEEKIRLKISDYIYGSDKDTLEAVVGELMISRNMTIALAESCTGGLLSSMITDIPGSSSYLMGSVVSYSNQSKIDFLQVDSEDLAKHGAVSEKVAIQMAKGAAARFKTDIGIGITGVAGPTGATADKPLGLVYIAISMQGKIKCYQHIFNNIRTIVRTRSAKMALVYLLKELKNLEEQT